MNHGPLLGPLAFVLSAPSLFPLDPIFPGAGGALPAEFPLESPPVFAGGEGFVAPLELSPPPEFPLEARPIFDPLFELSDFMRCLLYI